VDRGQWRDINRFKAGILASQSQRQSIKILWAPDNEARHHEESIGIALRYMGENWAETGPWSWDIDISRNPT
jgi:hypothetical protein